MFETLSEFTASCPERPYLLPIFFRYMYKQLSKLLSPRIIESFSLQFLTSHLKYCFFALGHELL